MLSTLERKSLGSSAEVGEKVEEHDEDADFVGIGADEPAGEDAVLGMKEQTSGCNWNPTCFGFCFSEGPACEEVEGSTSPKVWGSGSYQT